MPKTIGGVGTRRRDTRKDWDLFHTELLKHYEDGDGFVSGGCGQGGDRFLELSAIKLLAPDKFTDDQLWNMFKRDRWNYCKQLGVKLHLAEWERFGKSAGFKRNSLIADDSHVLIALVSTDRTGGTEDTIAKFEKLNKGRAIII